MKFILPVFTIFVGLLGIYLVRFHAKEIDKNALLAPDHLEKYIPQKILGATSIDKPLGETEEVVKAAESILLVSDFLNREYTLSNGEKVSVYISYWMKAKETLERATTHTPDRCWVRNGWQCNPKTRNTADVIDVDGKQLKPAIYGEYTIAGNGQKHTRYVWYWFLADGEVYQFEGKNYIPNPFTWLKNALTATVEETPEMYFIRIDSDKPLEHLRNNKEFKQILSHLGDMILFNNSKDTDNAKRK